MSYVQSLVDIFNYTRTTTPADVVDADIFDENLSHYQFAFSHRSLIKHKNPQSTLGNYWTGGWTTRRFCLLRPVLFVKKYLQKGRPRTPSPGRFADLLQG